MARTPQDPQLRITEILDAAECLFSDKGYRGTTISDIAKKMGVAQGLLYYYFKSKEEILESLIKRQHVSIMTDIGKIANSATLHPSSKIATVIHTLLLGVQYKGGLFLELLHDEQQLKIKYQITRHCNRSLAPCLLQIIAEGVEKQVFQAAHPQTALDFILIIIDLLISSLPEKLPPERLLPRLSMAAALIEKTLQAQPGTIHIFL